MANRSNDVFLGKFSASISASIKSSINGSLEKTNRAVWPIYHAALTKLAMEFSSSLIAIATITGLTGFAIGIMVKAYKQPIAEIPFPNAVIEQSSLPLSTGASQAFVGAVGTYKAGDYRGATEQFGEVLKQEPNCAEAFHNMALAYANIGDNDKALRSFLKAGDAYDKQNTKEGIDRIKQELKTLKAAS
ncbi:MAG: hypothetical protein AAFY72_05645 [Cyanobacteria bacterium J06649_4]